MIGKFILISACGLGLSGCKTSSNRDSALTEHSATPPNKLDLFAGPKNPFEGLTISVAGETEQSYVAKMNFADTPATLNVSKPDGSEPNTELENAFMKDWTLRPAPEGKVLCEGKRYCESYEALRPQSDKVEGHVTLFAEFPSEEFRVKDAKSIDVVMTFEEGNPKNLPLMLEARDKTPKDLIDYR